MDDARRARYSTVSWNNRLATVLGLLTLGYAVFALSTSTLSDGAAFLGMTLIGAVY